MLVRISLGMFGIVAFQLLTFSHGNSPVFVIILSHVFPDNHILLF